MGARIFLRYGLSRDKNPSLAPWRGGPALLLVLRLVVPPPCFPAHPAAAAVVAWDHMASERRVSSGPKDLQNQEYCYWQGDIVSWKEKVEPQQLRFGVFREGVFQKMPALEGQFLKEISVRFAGENHLRTQKNTKQSSAQRFLNDPFFSAAEKNT